MFRWLPCILVVGCYQPELAPGLPCSPDGECPSGQACVPGANICVDPEQQSATSDASPTPDTPDLGPDATPASGNDSCTDVFPSPLTNLARCDIPTPGPTLTLGAGEWSLSTDDLSLTGPDAAAITATTLTQDGGPELAVVVAESIEIADGATVRVTGSRPLVLLAATSLSVAGVIDASADLEIPGPGGTVSCIAGSGADGQTQSITGSVTVEGGSGGGGGGFGGQGGTGAIVNQSVGALPSAGGASDGGPQLAPLTGGCAGGAGGNGGGPGGGGGGAVQLSAVGAVTVTSTGVIDTAGGGGQATPPVADFTAAGGGGGGSGGAILLEGTQVTVAGLLAANGGSGACGKFYDSSVPGSDGSNTATPSPGVSGTNINSGPGGAGSAGSAVDGSAGSEGTSFVSAPGCTSFCFNIPAGGGGGGGGVGRIRIEGSAVDLTGLVTPAPQ
ncbi:MAG: hypothetical protein KJO07_25965 [Deltaproteobacteria bacterium]|nr:hypothetical protein [Deltaproteobacteria bacterium]